MKVIGFTLLELLLVTAVLVTLLAAVLPGAAILTASMRVFSASNSLQHTLKYARAEAITRSRTVRICASRDGQSCSPGKDWAEGWLVYLDRSGRGTRSLADPVLRFIPGPFRVAIHYNLNGYTVKFNAAGRLSRNGSFYICDPSGKAKPNRLVMIHSGRVRQTSQGVRCA